VGSSGEGASSADDAVVSDPVTDAEQLTIELSGETKYRADEGVSLTYTVGGSAAGSATITYDGPVELSLDTAAGTVPASTMSRSPQRRVT
jgi:hypothetical protein